MRRKREERRLCSTQTAIERQHKHKLDHSAWYSLLSQAATPLPSSPLPTLIKHHLLHNHRSLQQQQQQLDHDSVNRTTKVLLGVPDFPAYSDDDGSERLPLERLRQVDLGGVGWGMDRPAIGSLLLLRILTPSLRTSSSQFVAEDWRGRCAPVQVFGVPVRVAEEAEGLGAWFSVGGIIALRTPYARSTPSSSGSYTIRVPSPLYFTLHIPPTSPLLALRPFPPSPTSSSHPLSAFAYSAGQLKAAGNEHFKRERLVAAKEAYEWALSAAAAAQSKGGRHTGTEEDDKRLEATLLSNLAATFLRLSPSLPRAAVKACISALALLPPSPPPPSPSSPDPLRAKLLFRLATAYYTLQLFSLTRSTLALLPLPFSSDAAALDARALCRLSEQSHGPSPAKIREVFLAAQAGALAGLRTAPDVADYASPKLSVVELPGKGRGVVATAPIERGELLLLSRPLAASSPAPKSRVSHVAALNALTKSLEPPGVVETVAELEWALALEGEGAGEGEGVGDEKMGVDGLRKEVEGLWAGEELKRGKGRMKERIVGAVTFNGFVVEDLATAPAPGGGGKLSPAVADPPLFSLSSSPTPSPAPPLPEDEANDADAAFHSSLALFPTPVSSLNHSCLPSTSYTFLTPSPFPLFLLRARRAIYPGEELTIEYTSVYEGLEEREKKCGGHGFRCGCEVCGEERRAGKVMRERRKMGEDEAWDLAHSLTAPTSPSGASPLRDELQRLVDRAKALYASIAATLPPCLGPSFPRFALYAPSRLLSLALSRLGRLQEAVEAETKGLEALGVVLDLGEEGEGTKKVRLREGPKGRDTDATLSALECARLMGEMGDREGRDAYLLLARDIEKGQGGEELFDLRFGGWLGRKGVDMGVLMWKEKEERRRVAEERG